jgi:hypothetical protein
MEYSQHIDTTIQRKQLPRLVAKEVWQSTQPAPFRQANNQQVEKEDSQNVPSGHPKGTQLLKNIRHIHLNHHLS